MSALDLFGQPMAPPSSGYERHRERMAQRSAEQSRSGRDIGPVPKVADPERRERCRLDLRAFALTYFPDLFVLEFSEDHNRVIKLIERAVLTGGRFALAMPRGSGKTTLCSEVAPLWAVLYGHRRYPIVIGAEARHATQIASAIIVQLETNDRLLEDFPEACYPIRCLEGIRQRALGQLSEDRPTRLKLTDTKVVLPIIDGAPSSGAVIEAVGVTGSIRGRKHQAATGESLRPDLALIDDPQTDESARSPSQVETRLSVIAKGVLGLAGPGQKIAGLAAVTVIEPDDAADRLLDGPDAPDWIGERCRALYSFPDRVDLWDEYRELYVAGLQRGDTAEASAFYAERRELMDQGARPAWPARYNDDELSAVEHCMRIYLTRPEAFLSEYQNEPARESEGDGLEILTPDELLARTSGVPRGLVPDEAERLVAFVDVQAHALFYTVSAFSRRFDGWVVDFGIFPDQGRDYVTYREAKKTLGLAYPSAGREGGITAGLDDLAEKILGREWRRHGGGVVPVELMLVDANYETETIYSWARASPHAARVMPSRGRYYGATAKPINERKRKRGERTGPGWFIPAPGGRRSIRELVWDANHWKSFTWSRLMTPKGDPSAMYLPGEPAEARRLRMLADQLTAETRQRVTSSSGRTIDEWTNQRNRDNHLLDTTVGTVVAASVLGVSLLEGERREGGRKRRRVVDVAAARRRMAQ